MDNNELTKKNVAEKTWYALSTDQCLTELHTSVERGLKKEEVAERRERFGRNTLPAEKQDSLLKVFVQQFADPLIYVLLAAGGVSLAIGHFSDSIFIFVVLAFNAVLGTIQEYKAQTSARSLQDVIEIKARVLRDGRRNEMAAEKLVPGDIVEIEAGWAVPADMRLVETQDLRVDESLLTGESLPVAKQADKNVEEAATVAERSTMVHAGTTVTEGKATAVVCAIATMTEVGKIAASLARESEDPPLVQRMRRLTRVIAVFILVAVVLVGLAQVAAGSTWAETFFLAVALAVSAIPAGLPVAVTVALSVAAYRMAQRNVIVRELPAVEGLGSCTTICSDKTGTLTKNSLSIRQCLLPKAGRYKLAVDDEDSPAKLHPVGEEESEPEEEAANAVDSLLLSGVLANEAEITEGTEKQKGPLWQNLAVTGDSVDRAFLIGAARLGGDPRKMRDDHEQVGEIAYSSKKKYAASFHRHGDRVKVHVKGAAEVIAEMCSFEDQQERERLLEQAGEMAADGYRVLALAAAEVEDEQGARDADDSLLNGLSLLGFAGLIDPLRPEAAEAVDRCHKAGVSVHMVTGDHPKTAVAIGRQLGIAVDGESAMTGAELVGILDDERQSGETEKLWSQVENTHVFARVEPNQKTKLVEFFQDCGHFVAVTGDGVNDAPALKAAHISVAMGKGGTDVARRTAKLILGDDNFASIVNGIEEGRIAYDNVRKVVWLLISTSVAELVLFALTLVLGMPIPLYAAQLLWLNLVTNGIQDVALAFEGREPDILERSPRRPDERIFNRRMIEQVMLTGLWMGVVGFAVYYYLINTMRMELGAARNLVLLLMVLFENAHIFNCRSESRSVFRISFRENPLLIVTVFLAQSVHLASMWIPGLNDVLGIAPVSLKSWGVLLAIALTVIGVIEVYKLFRKDQLRSRKGGSYE